MLRTVAFLALVISTCAAYPPCAKAHIQPSEEMNRVLRAQAERSEMPQTRGLRNFIASAS